MGRPRSKLTEQQAIYVDARLEGKTKKVAATEAGYITPQGPESSETVKQEIAKARQQLVDLTTLKRLDVIEGIMDGIACARMQGDSGNVIKGWTEIAKILGHYAPEVKKIELSMGQQRLRSKFEGLSDEDLLAIAEGTVIDGTAERVN